MKSRLLTKLLNDEAKEIKNYLHLYLGCEVQTTARAESSQGKPMGYRKGKLVDIDIQCNNVGIDNIDTGCVWFGFNEIRPILRPFSDFKEEDIRLIAKISAPDSEITDSEIDIAIIQIKLRGIKAIDFEDLSAAQVFEITILLLQQEFDLFGLIDAGLAIDKTKL